MFLNLLISIAFASPLLVKAPNANSNDFFVYSQNNEIQKISSKSLLCSVDVDLQRLLKEAQFHFLNGSLEKSRTTFQIIADNKWNCDWKDDERKIITFAFFRLAQMSSSDSEQIQYLTDAINFDDKLNPDEVIFPPPTVELYNKLKKQLFKKSITLPDFAKKYSYVLRNGQFMNLSSMTMDTYSLRARYTFVSDTYKTESFTVTAAELIQSSINPVPLIEGDCGNYKLTPEILALQQEIKIFFSNDCIVDSHSNSNEPLKTSARVSSQQIAFPDSFPVPEKKTWIQRNYLWVGAAVVASLLIAHQIHENNEEQVTVPTTTFNNQ